MTLQEALLVFLAPEAEYSALRTLAPNLVKDAIAEVMNAELRSRAARAHLEGG
jgi:hypothetical protein